VARAMKEDSDQAFGSSAKPATKYRIIIGQPFNANMIKTQDFQRNGKKSSSNGISVAIAWTTTGEPCKVNGLSKRAIMVQWTGGRGIALSVARCTRGFVVRPPIVVPIVLVALILGSVLYRAVL
jgi:hypothetical protein